MIGFTRDSVAAVRPVRQLRRDWSAANTGGVGWVDRSSAPSSSGARILSSLDVTDSSKSFLFVDESQVLEGGPIVGGVTEVAGEPFFIEIDEGIVYLRHDRWSIVGAGSSLLEAEESLMQEARELVAVLAECPAESLSAEVLRMQEFLLGIE